MILILSFSLIHLVFPFSLTPRIQISGDEFIHKIKGDYKGMAKYRDQVLPVNVTILPKVKSKKSDSISLTLEINISVSKEKNPLEMKCRLRVSQNIRLPFEFCDSGSRGTRSFLVIEQPDDIKGVEEFFAGPLIVHKDQKDIYIKSIKFHETGFVPPPFKFTFLAVNLKRVKE